MPGPFKLNGHGLHEPPPPFHEEGGIRQYVPIIVMGMIQCDSEAPRHWSDTGKPLGESYIHCTTTYSLYPS